MPNSLDRDQFRQDVRDVNYAARRAVPSALIWIGVFVAVIAVISVGTWYFRVATAGVKGAGDTVRQNQDVNNRVAQQRVFVNLYEGVQAKDDKIQLLADKVARDAGGTAQQDLDGTQQICIDQVADYNAKVQETLAADWLPETLPSRIGDDPSTDCRPDQTPAVAPSK